MPVPDVKAGMVLTAAILADFGREGTWTPALVSDGTNPNLGTGPTQNGDWHYKAGLITVQFEIVLGTGATAGTGNYRIQALPFSIDAGWVSNAIGEARIVDVSTGDPDNWHVVVQSTTQFRIENQAGAQMGAASPWAWAAGDSIRGVANYKSA